MKEHFIYVIIKNKDSIQQLLIAKTIRSLNKQRINIFKTKFMTKDQVQERLDKADFHYKEY